MYKILRFCTSCNLYKEPVQVATCTSSLYKLQRVQDWLHKLLLVLNLPSNNPNLYNTVVQVGF